MIQKVKKENGINLPSVYPIPERILRKGGVVGYPIVYLRNGEEAFVCRVLCAWENERTILLENLERLEDCFYAVDLDDVNLYSTFMQTAAALNNEQEKPKLPSYIFENKEFGINLLSSKCKDKGLVRPLPEWIKNKAEAGRFYFVSSNYPTPCPCMVTSGIIDDKVVLKPLIDDFCQRINSAGYTNYIVASEEDFGVKFFYDIASAQSAFLNNLSQKLKGSNTVDPKEPTDVTPERKPGYHYEQEKERIYTPDGMILFARAYNAVCNLLPQRFTYTDLEKRIRFGSSWDLLTVIDFLEELKIIKLYYGDDQIMRQNWMYCAGDKYYN